MSDLVERLRDLVGEPADADLREEAADEIERLRTERDELLALVKDLADDLASEVEGHYQGIKDHPAMAPKYERDMVNVIRARAAIVKAEGR
jgi:hypothetical protein